MSFTNDVQNGLLFSQRSNESFKRANVNFNNSLSQIANPYYDLTSNVKAIGHPFFHATQLLRDAGRFVYGAFVLAGALPTGNLSAAGEVAIGMVLLAGAAVLEILNIAISIVSLATRFVASVFNFGYVSTSVQLRAAYLNSAEIGGRNKATIMNTLPAFSLSAIKTTSRMNDALEHVEAFRLI